MPFTALVQEEAKNQTIIFNLINDPEDFFDLNIQELRDLIDDKKSPFRVVGINKTLLTVCAHTLAKDNLLPKENALYSKKGRSKFKTI